jgi:hypothetical protein
MWILHFLPDSYLHLAVFSILFTGIGLYVFGLFINFFPPAYPYREPIRIIATLLTIAGIYFYGSYDTEMQWRGKVADLEKDLDKAIELSNENKVKIITEYVTVTKTIHDKEAKVVQNIASAAPEINAKCTLSPIAVDLHNQAATLIIKDPVSTMTEKPLLNTVSTPSIPKGQIILPKKESK